MHLSKTMSKNLFLSQARARRPYHCKACGAEIAKGAIYFRHDPFNGTNVHKKPTTHWCVDCIGPSGALLDPSNGRLRVAMMNVLANRSQSGGELFVPARVELVHVTEQLSPMLAGDPSLVHALSPRQFQALLCERLEAMGFEPRQVGDVYRKDGGIDILFWPRQRCGFPFLGAVQAKHHRSLTKREGPSGVRDFAGVLAGHPINIGLMVTNTSFTADAEWFARNKAPLLRLRDFKDIQRWLTGNFASGDEWRDVPESIEVCPGLVVAVGGTRGRV